MLNTQEQQKVNFEKFSHEANAYINKLSEDLGHPDEQNRVYTLLQS